MRTGPKYKNVATLDDLKESVYNVGSGAAKVGKAMADKIASYQKKPPKGYTYLRGRLVPMPK